MLITLYKKIGIKSVSTRVANFEASHNVRFTFKSFSRRRIGRSRSTSVILDDIPINRATIEERNGNDTNRLLLFSIGFELRIFPTTRPRKIAVTNEIPKPR